MIEFLGNLPFLVVFPAFLLVLLIGELLERFFRRRAYEKQRRRTHYGHIFTKKTYRVAIRRAYRIEMDWHRLHAASFCGPKQWIRAAAKTDRLLARKKREL